MTKLQRAAWALSAAALVGLSAGCGGDDSMQTPSNSSTVTTDVSTGPVTSSTSVPRPN